ncbi:MAG: peptidase, partial [Pricia sp.]|nr:peptidase [Pricia sp.]
RKKYPLAVCLHHGGGNGIDNVMQVQTSEMAKVLATSKNRENYPAFIFVPQCPPGSSFGGIPNFTEISDLVFDAMADLENNFSIDENRRYVMGMSLGGFGSWHFIGKRPELFAAALPICGGGNPDHAKNMVDIPIWAFHGAEDTNVPVNFSRSMIDGIKKAGGDPKYIEFERIGHNIWQEVDQTPGKLEWLFAQQKE